MRDLDFLLRTVSTVHDSCFDAGAWTNALSLVASLLDSNGVVVALEDKTRGFPISFEGMTAPEARSDYLSTYNAIDPVIAYVRSAPAGTAYPDWVAIERADLDRTRFHQEFGHRYDYGRCMQAFTHRESICSGFFVAARPLKSEPFDESDRGLLNLLIPHFERALRIRTLLGRAEIERVSALDALDRLNHGVFLVDDDLTILFANREGQRLLRERDGLGAPGSKLTASRPADAARLRIGVGRLLAGGLDDAAAVLPVARPPPRRPLFLRIAGLTATMAEQIPGARASACIFVHDPEHRRVVAPAPIQAMLGLTAAEARVASLLAEGYAVGDIALRLGVSLPTVRTHLRRVFSKTDTSRQAELVMLIGKIPTT